ncbi:hypothetical protein L0664_01280 [Octadecabacter sp. G9-8]|uniref:CTP synthetase n=1 Tax=Octadecabacter dasysiphoniae TaxID=2909341 RepID=A0ABS9CTC3_9RHOB|nr:hypothetical protein [Octadecabacter dasysiphoniae]MCF2869685.1 hypothetical protein [Octadecabacter dasysiphoniae]
MTNLIIKLKSAVSNAVLFASATFMVGLGFAFVGTIALFGLVAVGVAMIAALFVTPPVQAPNDAEIAT